MHFNKQPEWSWCSENTKSQVLFTWVSWGFKPPLNISVKLMGPLNCILDCHVNHQQTFLGIYCVLAYSTAAATAKSLQSCLTLCDSIDGSPSGSTVPGILQARTLEWVAISFSNAWKWGVKVKLLSLVRLLATPWTAAYQAPPSMGFSRQEYWSGVPLPSLTSGLAYTYFVIKL